MTSDSPNVAAAPANAVAAAPVDAAFHPSRETVQADAPARKSVLTVLWFLVLGSAVYFFHYFTDDRSEQRGGDAKETEIYTPSIGGVTSPPVSEESVSLFEAPDKESAKKKVMVRPRKPHQPVEDTTGALCPFFKALAALDRSESRESVRILHYGDSILTTDELSGRIRSQLQKRFGDGGHGFVLLGKPWRWYRHQNVQLGSYGKWQVRSLTSSPSRDGIWGLGGVTFDTDKPRAKAWVGTDPEAQQGARVASFDLSFLQQARGGSMDVLINDDIVETLSTKGEPRGVVHKVFEVDPGPATLSVKTHGDGPVRVFGAVMESDHPGIVYDALAINGVRVANFRRFDEDHFEEELQHREADLVVMMCGANEGNNDALALGAYKDNLLAVLQRIRRAVPEAGCLVVGPLDQAERTEDGALVSKKMPRKLTRLQREVSLAAGCAFFDTYTAMGGKESMPKWYRRGLVGADFIHPTETGAKIVGSWLTEALLAGYENFLFNGEQCEPNVTSL